MMNMHKDVPVNNGFGSRKKKLKHKYSVKWNRFRCALLRLIAISSFSKQWNKIEHYENTKTQLDRGTDGRGHTTSMMRKICNWFEWLALKLSTIISQRNNIYNYVTHQCTAIYIDSSLSRRQFSPIVLPPSDAMTSGIYSWICINRE